MPDRALIDTNILVYAHDPSSGQKNTLAIGFLARIHDSGAGVLSTQVLMEFTSVVTSKIPRPLTMKNAASQVRNLIASWPVLPITPLIVDEALRGASSHRLSLWDSLIWSTARMNQIPTVFSEDFRDGAELDGVRFVNPLKF